MKTVYKLTILLLALVAAALLLIRSGVTELSPLRPDSTPAPAAETPVGTLAPQPAAEPEEDAAPPPEEPAECLHLRHDPETLLCLDCGEPQTHRWHNGACAGCGISFEFHDSFLPASWYGELPEALRGRVESCYFPYGEDPVKALVYLPCHYDEEPDRRYNVLILLPTINGTAETCMSLNLYTPYGVSSMRTLYDHLFLSGDCAPAIVVSLDFIDSFELTEGLLRNELLPYLAGHYRTYAEDSSAQALRAAREHLAIGGVSNGALQTCFTGLERMSDLCANFAVLSGALRQEEIAEALNGKFSEYPLDMVFIAFGENDSWAEKAALPLYEELAGEVERCVPGENLVLHILPGLEHNWDAFHLEILDALLLCFPHT